MGMVVQHNMNALNAYNKLNSNVSGLKKSSEKLSSGYRINRAGDDAAGLAISEKMRSQIRGLTQAKRNAQDGISLIQTFEGAAQESHSILQRMKELATEAANGTYQNEVDRDAIQLEFDQLNDELNQIADTDFNGVVMLNGGQMADGTKAVSGQFDYVNGTKAASKLSKSDVNVLDGQAWDDGTVANTAWAALNPTWTRTSGQPDTYGPDSVDVTFKFNSADGSWTAIDATNAADVTKITADKTENGGFGVQINGVDVANVVLDQTKLANGDTITLTFNNPATGIDAPTNAGATVSDATNFTEGSIALKDADVDVALDAGLTDEKMTQDIQSALELLDGATFTANYTAKTASTAADFSITLSDGTTIAGSTAGTKITVGSSTFSFTTTDAGVLTIKDETSSITLAKITATAAKAADTSSGSIEYKIGIDHSTYDAGAVPSVEVAKTGNVSKANSNNAATAPLTYTDHLVLQTGARTKDSVDFTFEYSTNGMGDLQSNLNISARADGLNTANLSLATQEDANAAIDQIDNAINKVSMVRATFGATQNRLEHKIENLTTTNENLTEAESGIRDTDMASEMLNYTKYNVLQQAAQSMLAQANQQPQSILQLLG